MTRNLLSRDVHEAVEQLLPYFLARIGQNVISGDLLPDTTGTRDLGSPSKPFDTLYARTVIADMIEATRALVEGLSPNLLKNGSFEQVEHEGATNQPRYWHMATETALSAAIGAD